MLVSPTKKNRINLADYDYKHDIKQRLLMSQFSIFDVEVLEEILNSSIKFNLSEIAEFLECDFATLLPSIDKLQQAGLLKYDKKFNIVVDKQMRKYYEFQFAKFNDDFRPGMEFLQGLLRKVPIQVLPSWYLIPRTSDNIFESLVEKYFFTPQIYERYLEELHFEDPILNHIMEDVFQSPELKLRSLYFREKYSLTRKEFEEYMLHLEYNFVCCLSYNRIEQEHGWREVITPFNEWRDYLKFKRKNSPHPLPENADVYQERDLPFAFVRDAKNILEIIKNKPLKLTTTGSFTKQVPTSTSTKIIIQHGTDLPKPTSSVIEQYLPYFSYIISKLCALNITENKEGVLHPCAEASSWLEMNDEDFAMHLYRHPANCFIRYSVPPNLSTSKANLREVEKGLKGLPAQTWFTCQDIIANMTEAVGDVEPVTLKKTGKNWEYVLPQYSEEEKNFIIAAIMERMFEAGLVQCGKYKDQDCFKTTALGSILLGS